MYRLVFVSMSPEKKKGSPSPSPRPGGAPCVPLQVSGDDCVVIHQYVRIWSEQRRCLRVVQLSHPFLSVPLPPATLNDAVGQQRRVGIVVGARGGGNPADVTRAGGAAGAAGGAAFGRRQVMLDDLSRRNGGSEVSGKSCISRRDGVPVHRDEALVGLRHGHGRPGRDLSHLARRGDSLGRVEVARRGCGEARVAEVADGAGAQ